MDKMARRRRGGAIEKASEGESYKDLKKQTSALS
jgi:hypothetical protein